MKFLILYLSIGLFSQSQIIIKKFDWKIYRTPHFDVYFYEDSKPLLPYLSKVLELSYEKARSDLNPHLNKRIPFFIFASENDMKQNSITEIGDGTGGLTEPYKKRFMVYNDGSKRWLRNVIFHEFGHEAQFSVLIDGWWESPKILKSIVYPLWMMEGMAENMTGDWEIAMEDMYVRDYTINNKLPPLEKLYGFSHLKPHQITLAYKTGSKAMRFLSEEYGSDKPSLMLYYFRDAYDINFVLRKLIGTDLEGFDKRFREYLSFKYFNQVKDENLKDAFVYGDKITRTPDNIPIFNITPVIVDENRIAYISTIFNTPPVIVIDDYSGKNKKMLDRNFLNVDNINYSRFTLPVRSLSISHNKRFLVFSAQKNNRDYLCVYDIKDNKLKKISFDGLDQARQFSFSLDDKRLVFVGMSKSINRIYEVEFEKVLKKDSLKIADMKLLVDDEMDKLSPQYISDKEIAYICETGDVYDIRNDLCLVRDNYIEKISFGIDINDFFYDSENNRIFFISDNDKIYNLYSLSLFDYKLYKHTSVIGGIFTPYYQNKTLLFSYFRNGEMNIYKSDDRKIEYKVINKEVLKEKWGGNKEDKNYKPVFEDYRFKASTDLFFPALLFSSPGGLFLFTYYQLSDFMGWHNFSTYLNYNSSYGYKNIQTTYFYNKRRTKYVMDVSYMTASDIRNNEYDIDYDKKYLKLLTGFVYPITRDKSFGLYFNYKDNKNTYHLPYSWLDYFERKRGVIASYIHNSINGVYLTAVYGEYLNIVFGYYDKFLNGNNRYNQLSVDYVKYIPLSRRSAIVNRFFGGFSSGISSPEFYYGGVGGVRGFFSTESSRNVFVDNVELRLCLFDMDYYMDYIFPDFYFKAFYLKFFSDNAYPFSTTKDISGLSGIKNSIGFGFNIHSFILQRYQSVFSFDWSFNTKTGERIMYFYLGPVF